MIFVRALWPRSTLGRISLKTTNSPNFVPLMYRRQTDYLSYTSRSWSTSEDSVASKRIRKKNVSSGIKCSQSTPMMNQWMKIREQAPGFIILFRMGDFYEMFHDDAITASQVLNIALTKRDPQSDIALCGFPHKALDKHLLTLIKHGYHVAICDQIESPQDAKNSKRIVNRAITRLVTPGTLIEEDHLNPRTNNFLLAIRSPESLAWLDLSTGEFGTATTKNIETDIARIQPSEILIVESTEDAFKTKISNALLSSGKESTSFSTVENEAFSVKNGFSLLQASITGRDVRKEDFEAIELEATGALLNYVKHTQRGKLPLLRLQDENAAETSTHRLLNSTMVIDASTRRCLELTHCTISGEKKGSVLDTLDKTVTGAGSRLLASHLNLPLLSPEDINNRLDAVEAFVERPIVADRLRKLLKEAADIERCVQRICLGRATPSDLAGIVSTLQIAEQMQERLEELNLISPPNLIKNAVSATSGEKLKLLLEELGKAVKECPPRDGLEFVRDGYSAELDELRTLRENGNQLIDELERRYRKETGISKLKIINLKTLGRYIQIPPHEESKAPNSFIDRRLLRDCIRYRSQELIDLESKIHRSQSDATTLEKEIFADLSNLVIENSDILRKCGIAIASIDVWCCHAINTIERGYVRPNVNMSNDFLIQDGRHPTVEISLNEKQRGSSFVPNDCSLSFQNRFWLITGPNMGGKSTFLRQNAIICIMAQMGSFVPASTATIGIVDRLHSRVGAADDLRNDVSTFMMEMIETAYILKFATPASFIIMDEVGRGTSTGDGFAIALAVANFLCNELKCRTLFATHYLELGELQETSPALSCHQVAILEEGNSIVFLHSLRPGVAERSYGLHVAKLAGLPENVITKAEEILNRKIQ